MTFWPCQTSSAFCIWHILQSCWDNKSIWFQGHSIPTKFNSSNLHCRCFDHDTVVFIRTHRVQTENTLKYGNGYANDQKWVTLNSVNCFHHPTSMAWVWCGCGVVWVWVKCGVGGARHVPCWAHDWKPVFWDGSAFNSSMCSLRF